MGSPSLLFVRLGRLIRMRRVRAGYTQAEFAHEAKVFRTYMGHIERGTANPTVEVLSGIARALGLSVADLLALAEKPEGEEQSQAQPSRHKRRRSPAG